MTSKTTRTCLGITWCLMISVAPGGGEECKTTATLILIFSLIFHPKTWRPFLTSQEVGHGLENISLLWSPFALQSNTPTPFYSSKTLDSIFMFSIGEQSPVFFFFFVTQWHQFHMKMLPMWGFQSIQIKTRSCPGPGPLAQVSGDFYSLTGGSTPLFSLEAVTEDTTVVLLLIRTWE